MALFLLGPPYLGNNSQKWPKHDVLCDYVHVMRNGAIVKTGDNSLAKELELKGYDWIE